MAASVQGPAHAASDKPREDAFAIAIEGGCAIAVLCDGAGSASKAALGATGFSLSVREAILQAISLDSAALEQSFRDAVVEGVEAFRKVILRRGLALRDHHATLLALVALPDRTLTAHVGDGLIGVAPDGHWAGACLSAPQNGEFANETFFVTEEDWSKRLRCDGHPPLEPNGAAVILTDGAMPFVIGAGERGLEPDFMAPVSRFLRSEAAGPAAEALAGTLDSADSRRISSDDKTVVWIAREVGS